MDSLKSLDFSSFIIFSDDPWSLLISFCQLFKLPLVVQCCNVICEWPLMCIWTSCLHQKKLGYGWGIWFANPLTFRWWKPLMNCEDQCYIDVKIEELYCSLRTDRKLQRQTNYWHNITSSSFCRSWCNAIKVTYFIWVQCTYSWHAEVVAILTENNVSILTLGD